MPTDERPSRRQFGTRHDAGLVALVIATGAVLVGAAAFTIYRFHVMRPGEPLGATVSLALPLVAYFGVAGIVLVVLGSVATARIERQAQRLIDARIAVTTELSQSEHRVSDAITRRKLAEDALRRSEERFQLAARATHDVLWEWDFTTGLIWRSDAMRRVFGHAESSAMAVERGTLLHPDDRERVSASLDEFLVSQRDTWTAEYRFERVDGSYAWVLDRGIVFREPAGKAIRMIGSMLDITERKEGERLKSDFVSFVSHQLRTPLSGMNWMLELAADAEGLPDPAKEYVAEARESAARLVRLVDDLLGIAELESGRTTIVHERVDLGDVTRSVVAEIQPLLADKGHVMEVGRLDAPPVTGDRQLLRQVIANLVSNAVKYTPAGGRIEVRMAHRDGTVEWLVQDNGIGIPRAAHGRLFEKFFRAGNAVSKEAEGSGLGLHVVRLIVEQTGGHVRVESDEGQGATFAFVLPVWREPGEGA
jgi:PAS domain S-box-containing protein